MKEKIRSAIFTVSAFAVLLSSAFYITQWFYIPYIFAVGAAGMASMRLSRRYEGNNIRLKRLYRLESLSSILIVLASYFMFKNDRNEWIVILFIAAVLQLYTAFLIPKIEESENEK